MGALIEYPETGLTVETYSGHLFHDSQGGPNGSHKDVTCLLLTDDLGHKIKCNKVNSTCTFFIFISYLFATINSEFI